MGEEAAMPNLEKEITPRVVAAGPSLTRSRAAAVRMGWSLNTKVPISAISTGSMMPSPKGTSR